MAEPPTSGPGWQLINVASAPTRVGYPDISYYLLEQREFLKFVEDTVRSTFSTG